MPSTMPHVVQHNDGNSTIMIRNYCQIELVSQCFMLVINNLNMFYASQCSHPTRMHIIIYLKAIAVNMNFMSSSNRNRECAIKKQALKDIQHRK